jgi:membrane protease YdiL (CAAX protease family)
MGACAEHGILVDAKGVASIETPPPQFEIIEGYPRPEVDHPRFVPGWILLGLVFSFLIFMALASYLMPRPEAEEASLKPYESQIRIFFTLKPVMLASAPPGSKVESDTQLQDVFEKLEPLKAESKGAAELLIATRHEADMPTREEDLAALGEGEKGKVFREVYGETPPSKARARAIQDELTGDTLAEQMAGIHALERAELPAPQRDNLFSKAKAAKVMALILGAIGLVFMGVAAWAAYFGVRRTGAWKPMGHPAEPLTRGESDWFAFRAGAIIVLFTLIGIGMEVFSSVSDNRAVNLALPGLIFLPMIFLIYNYSSAAGISITLQRIGVRKKDFGRHILWGVGAWLATIPLLAASTFVISLLLRFLPSPSHPATDLLQNSPDTPTIMALLFAAAVVAPIWEEIMFRGTMLPAISRATKSPAWGIAISSFLFAAIHPQGLVLWLSLATVGAMAAMVTYQTKSLVPAIVLHAVHNFAILMMGLLVNSI